MAGAAGSGGGPGREAVVMVVAGELVVAGAASTVRAARSWRALGARLLAAAALLTGLASCGAGAVGAGSLPGPCPARAPGQAGAPRAASPAAVASPAGAPLIRRGAVVAVICQYALDPSPKTVNLLPRIVLRGPAAAGLAAVLDDARPASSLPRCSPFPYRQLIVFGYRTLSLIHI